MTKEDILSRVHRGELSIEDASNLLDKLSKLAAPSNRKPPTFKVSEKGWCIVYFDGMRYPCTLPSQVWLELIEPNNLERFKKFLEENKQKFRNKE